MNTRILHVPFLGTLQNCEKLLLASSCLSACLSICPCIRMKQIGSHWTNFHEIWDLGIFWKCVEKLQVSLNSNELWMLYIQTNINLWSYRTQFFLETEMFQTVWRASEHISYLQLSFQNCAIYEIMWKSIVQAGRPQMEIWSMHCVYWKTKATNTHTQNM